MGMVSREQSHEAMAKLGTKVNWGAISSEDLQAGIEAPDLGEQFTLFLANRAKMQIVLTIDGIQIPEGGRIHIVAAPVNESRDWGEAIKAAGPNIGKDWEVWRMGEHYPPTEVGMGIQKVILVNFGKNTRSEDNLAWARSQRLKPISPRAALAVGEHCPTLNKDMGLEYMAVVSLVPCSFGGEQCVVVSWWRGSERGARHDWFDSGWFDYFWFGFSREDE